MKEIKISVRSLVEFILRSGNIDNRRARQAENAMQEGGRIHRMIQRRMGADYRAEVLLRYIYKTTDYEVHIEGRADGIMVSRQSVTVDEIKGTYRDVRKMKGAVPVHVAQAQCYAYIYGSQKHLEKITVRLTYCNMNTEEIRYFHFDYEMKELEEWFEELMEQYRKWADFQFQWQRLRTDSIKSLPFPFPYREGQKELASYVYQTIYHRRKLFIEAPTGAGKTITTLFPAVKAVGEGIGDKIFYLTAKTITRTVAEHTLGLFRKEGLRLKSVILTAKDKICFMEERECNPDYCPYARGHFDRINDAIYGLLTSSDSFTREAIEACAREHRVCPFEMGLDISLFSDVIVGDYNYLFDPHVYLRRFFSDGARADYLFLVDEAHNLVDRGREMYSAVLYKEAFLEMKKAIEEYDQGIGRQLGWCNRELLELKRQCEDYICLEETDASPFVKSLAKLSALIEAYLEDNEDSPVKRELLDFYFEVSHFLLIHDRLDRNYVIYAQTQEDGGFLVRLLCVNPSKNLRECMQRGRSTMLFSATLLPIQYYKRLLGAEEGDYEVYAHSVFDPRKKGLFIAGDVTSKYTRRSEEEYYNIAAYLHRIVSQREGNYLAFFPSHAFLQRVYEIYRKSFQDRERVECLLQEDYMDEEGREEFLARFERAGEGSLLGLCVLGGIFGEGIDLKNDCLIGAVIVGTGLPQVCCEREILKQYFDGQGDNGFDFAYKYPGMNKVLQAAGRVIRTAEDIGIVALLDERFLHASYQNMFPREWDAYERVNVGLVGKRVERFWDEWL